MYRETRPCALVQGPLSYFGNFRVWHFVYRLHSTDLSIVGVYTFVQYCIVHTISNALNNTSISISSFAIIDITWFQADFSITRMVIRAVSSYRTTCQDKIAYGIVMQH